MSGAVNALVQKAQVIFGNQELAMWWINRPNSLCGGITPAEAVSTPTGHCQVERQLAWFAGSRPPIQRGYPGEDDRLTDVIEDPLVQMVLDRAGSGPEELLRLCSHIESQRRAA